MLLQFFADVRQLSGRYSYLYIYPSESSPFTLLENGVGYYAMT